VVNPPQTAHPVQVNQLNQLAGWNLAREGLKDPPSFTLWEPHPARYDD
jgi:hypothetical protein